MNFLENTIDDKRLIGALSLDSLIMWIDAGQGVYNNICSQTAGVMSLGHGILQGRSTKQRNNTKSSTESELVAVSEILPLNIWITNFLDAQGYNFSTNTIMQDNTSAIKLENNGKSLFTGNSRHIDIQYFFVSD